MITKQLTNEGWKHFFKGEEAITFHNPTKELLPIGESQLEKPLNIYGHQGNNERYLRGTLPAGISIFFEPGIPLKSDTLLWVTRKDYFKMVKVK